MIDKLLEDMLLKLNRLLYIIDKAQRYCMGKDDNEMAVLLGEAHGIVTTLHSIVGTTLTHLRKIAYMHGIEETK